MFDKLRQLNELRNIQNAIKKETVEVAREGVRVVMNGAFDLLELTLNPELDIKMQERLLKECIANAKESMQKRLAKNFAGSLFR